MSKLIEDICKNARTSAINMAKKFVADTEATTFGQNESAKTIIRLLIKEGYIDSGIFESKATDTLPADKRSDLEAVTDEMVHLEKLRLFSMIHPLTNAAAMNRTLKDDGILVENKAKNDMGF